MITHKEDVDEEHRKSFMTLKMALMVELCNNGVLGKLKAQLRASAVSSLRGKTELADAAVGKTINVNNFSQETKIVLLLIREFLIAHDINITAGIFEEECSLAAIDDESQTIVETRFFSANDPARYCVPTSSSGDKKIELNSMGNSTPYGDCVTTPCLTLLVKDALQRMIRSSAEDLQEMLNSGGRESRTGDNKNEFQLSSPSASYTDGVAYSKVSGNELPGKERKNTEGEGGSILLTDGSQIAIPDLEHDIQLQELRNTPSVAQAVQELEGSFAFSDTEGGLTQDDIVACHIVDVS